MQKGLCMRGKAETVGVKITRLIFFFGGGPVVLQPGIKLTLLHWKQSFTLGTTREVLFLKNIIYLFLVALGLRCCEQGALPDCGAWDSHCGGCSCCREHAQQLWCTGLAALQCVESSQTRDQTRVPCTGWQILNQWTTREVSRIFKASKNIINDI